MTGQSWSRSAPGQGRGHAAAVSGYDEANDRLILFGGTGTTDESVWILRTRRERAARRSGRRAPPSRARSACPAPPPPTTRPRTACSSSAGAPGIARRARPDVGSLERERDRRRPAWSLLLAAVARRRASVRPRVRPDAPCAHPLRRLGGRCGRSARRPVLLEGVDGAPAWRLLATAG